MKQVLMLLFLAACGKRDSTPVPIEAGGVNAPGALVAGGATPRVERFDAAEIAVPPGQSQLHVAWSVPSGTAINDDAPFGVRWASSDGLVASPSDIRGTGKDVRNGFDVPIDVMAGADGAMLSGDIDLVVCDIETHSVCVPLKRRLELTFAIGKGRAQGRVTLPLPKAKP